MLTKLLNFNRKSVFNSACIWDSTKIPAQIEGFQAANLTMHAKRVSPSAAMVTKICKYAHYIYNKSAQIQDKSQIFVPNWVFWRSSNFTVIQVSAHRRLLWW